MQKIIALSFATLIVGAGAAFAAQPLNPSFYGPKVTAADRDIARIAAPGDIFSTSVTDEGNWHAVKTYKVQPDGTPKLIDFSYSNLND
ncbi:hypothetical protein [Martelella radicis]|uniref:PepSY domain-containing protein n=1 Tax=Martelella radicis TaxID=1397476 RepID=A0A7W6P8L9_9HYPH|nr:hypothetical protein [Martelella radicis]MBB4121387.1 hypothetical protein [Martelella radicis]